MELIFLKLQIKILNNNITLNVQAGITPVGNFITAIALENIAEGEFIDINCYQNHIFGTYGGTNYMNQFWNIGKDNDGNDLVFYATAYWSTSTGGQYIKIFKRTDSGFTLLSSTDNLFRTSKTTSMYNCNIVYVKRFNNTNKLMLVISDRNSNTTYASVCFAEINLTTYAITKVGDFIYSPSTSNINNCEFILPYYDEINNKIIFMSNVNASTSYANAYVNVLQLNSSYTSATWVLTTVSYYHYPRNAILKPLGNETYLLYEIGSTSTSSSSQYIYVYTFKINSDNTASIIQDRLQVVSASYATYISSAFIKINTNQYMAFTGDSYKSGSQTYLSAVLITVNSDNTVTSKYQNRVKLGSEYIGAYGSGFLFELGNNNYEFIIASERNNGYYEKPEIIKFHLDLETTGTNFIVVDSVTMDNSYMNGIQFPTYPTYRYCDIINRNHWYFVSNQSSSWNTQLCEYYGKRIRKATTNITGISCESKSQGENIKVCLKEG